MENSTQLLMNQVMHRYVQRSMQLLRNINIHPGQCGLLLALKHNNGLPQKKLAEKLGVKPPSITVMLKKMEAEGYIIKKQDEKDQRITRIFITPEGEEIADQTKEMLDILGKEAFAGIKEEELMLLRRLLLQMKDNLSNNN